jgi:hypothetical protein
MKQAELAGKRELPGLKVNQWLSEWKKVPFSTRFHRRQPEPHFYIFKLQASWLKSLSGIYRRTTQAGQLRSSDLGIQRRHDQRRSDEIREFVQYGYPWSELSRSKRESGEFDDLRKPGWLPTSIVVNILQNGDKRRGLEVAPKDLIAITDSGNAVVKIRLPDKFAGDGWKPERLHPIEVIDGQHRLWAFEDGKFDDQFELPVVAFHGLDISWQAYLFWTINIRPKRINASLAFDLYPLLRTEDWLEKFEGHSIYRETRSQELTEALWAIPESPWHQRINMLGEPGLKEAMVSQAAWIRSLMATFVKSWEGRGITIGGLFGAQLGKHEEVLAWSRAQQAAFLIYLGRCVREAIQDCKERWAKSLREAPKQSKGGKPEEDPAFYGPYTLLSTDQGIRGLLYVTNDICYVRANDLKLQDWVSDTEAGASDEDAVRVALNSIKTQPIAKFLRGIAEGLSNYDWRTSSFPDLSETERIRKAALRGSGGYKELRQGLLRLLATEGRDVGKAAKEVLLALGYDK